MTKPEYVEFFNQIHLLDLQAIKGAKIGKQLGMQNKSCDGLGWTQNDASRT